VRTAEAAVQDTLTAGCKPWNNCDADTPEQLTALIEQRKPKRIFFFHWNWIVPDEIIDNYECICFHMTDLPYGRGGSPLQNLILRGHQTTKLTALRMTKELDAGPIYCQRELSLHGTAQEIYMRAEATARQMMDEITRTTPTPQRGEVVIFQRRTSVESRLPPLLPLGKVYDFIRMLDAETYPKAYIEYGGYRIELQGAAIREGKVIAEAVIMEGDNESLSGGGSSG
jgi:methionyl-tRNA formyltransferase